MPSTRVAVQMALTKTEAFETLGVSHNERLDADEIKSAYRQASKRLHPDRVSDGPRRELAATQFAEFNAVYDEILHDVEKQKEQEQMAAFWLVGGAAVVAGATLMGADPLLPGLGVGAAGAVAKLTSMAEQPQMLLTAFDPLGLDIEPRE